MMSEGDDESSSIKAAERRRRLDGLGPRADRHAVGRLACGRAVRTSSRRSSRPPRSSGSRARRSADVNRIPSAPSGGPSALGPTASTSVPCSTPSSSSSTAASESVATMTVGPCQRCGTAASTRAWASVWRSAGGHSSSPNSTPASSGSRGTANGPSSSSRRSNSSSTWLLEVLGNDQLVPVPDVRQLGIGQRLGQLRPLVDRPRRRRRSAP